MATLFSQACRVALTPAKLANHPIRPRQHVRQNRETNLFGRFEIDIVTEISALTRIFSAARNNAARSGFGRWAWREERSHARQ
jgi:hypothetical protein